MSQSMKKRSVKPLPVQLLDHVTVCLEEQLYPQAFDLLSSTLLAGHSSNDVPTYIPPLQHLSIAATLSAHPSLTTRTRDKERHQAADEALAYLHNVRRVVGVRDAGLDKALQFTPKVQSVARNKRAKKGKVIRLSGHLGDDSEDEDALSSARIRSTYVEKGSLWTNAEDFWSVVGWAFNCSVAHPHRWSRWKLWLAFMLDVLDSDLTDHAAKGTAEQSLLADYLRPIGQGRNSKRRLMRAILADGGAKSLGEFGEVWKGETRLPKVEDKPNVKKRKLDVENGEFGDYFDREDSDLEGSGSLPARSRSASAFPTTRTSRLQAPTEPDISDEDSEIDVAQKSTTTKSPAPSSTHTSPLSSFGGLQSITLRQRLFALLTRFSLASPTTFLDTEDLFDLFTEFLRPLPVPIFQQMVFPAKRWLSIDEQSSLNQMLLRPLLASAAPAYDANTLTQADFETHYAPFSANNSSAVDNTKVALLVEDLLVLLWKTGGLAYTGRLRTVVEDGVEERRAKAASDGRRKSGAKLLEDEEAVKWMEGAGVRMEGVLHLIE